MIDGNYFLNQSRRLRQTRHLFQTLESIIPEYVSASERSLEQVSYTGSGVSLKETYKTSMNIGDGEYFEFFNQNVRIQVQANKPVGWITVIATKNFGFEKQTIRGAASITHIGPGQLPTDRDEFRLNGIGFLHGVVNIREIAEKLTDVVYESDLTEADCILKDGQKVGP